MLIIVMLVVSVLAVFFILEIMKAGSVNAAEIMLSKAWGRRFSIYRVEEKKNKLVYEYSKYHKISKKQAAKKIRAWDKEIEGYRKTEVKYMSGKGLSVIDMIPLFGYQIMKDMQIDAKNDFLRHLSKDCEHTGFMELERDRTTNATANS